MGSKYLHIKSFHLILMIMIALLTNVTVSFAQNKMTKLRDGSVSGNVPTAVDFSILELESSTKGFLLPRMTTQERNKINISDKERGNGLAIYNTDNDCINYWSKTAGGKDGVGNFIGKWLSVCGTLPPAKLTLDCNKIYLNTATGNELKQGQSLKDTDILYVTVTVIESGSYNISAISKNGYSFGKSGVFETPGTYSIALEGFGTPLEAKEAPNYDSVTFKLNGKDHPSCTYNIQVKSSALNFSIVEPQTITVGWSAYKGVPLNANDNAITIKVNVTSPGFWRIQSDKPDNGISFSGSGEFKEGVSGEQSITIYGQGTPELLKDSTFKLTTNSKGNTTSNVTVTVHVVPTSFELVCDPSKIEIRGEYKEDTYLNKSNSILLPIKVLAPGVIDIEVKGIIKGDTDTEIKFRAPNTVIGFNKPSDIQYITLYAEEKLVPLKATEVVFTSMTPSSVTICPDFPKKTVTKKSRNYSFDCAATVMMAGNGQENTNNYFLVNSPLQAGKQGLYVSVNVGYAESYTIKTDEVNGVYFKKSGTFTEEQKKSGKAIIILDPFGSFQNVGSYYFSLYTEGLDNDIKNACSIVADVRGRSINVLGIGGYTYAPRPGQSAYAPNAILTSSKNFGPLGKYKTGAINLTWMSNFPDDLGSHIANNGIDVIVIGYHTSLSDANKNALINFVRNQKGGLIVADESNFGGSQMSIQLVNGIAGGGNSITASNSKASVFSLVNPVIGASTDPVITSEFGSIAGGKLGNDVAANGWYFSGLPSSYVRLAVSAIDNSAVFAFRHDTYGFVFIGDGGAFAGSATNRSDHIWPAAILRDGTPVAKAYIGGEVSNSIFYANALRYVIDYVTKNKPLN